MIRDADNLEKFGQELDQDNQKYYMGEVFGVAEAVEKNQNDFREYLRKQAVEVFNCDQECVNDCTNN